MKTKIVVEVDRNAAILVGFSEYGTKVVEFNPADFTPEQRSAITMLPMHFIHNDDNLPSLENFSRTYEYYGHYQVELPKIPNATIDNIKLQLDAIISQTEQKKIKLELLFAEKVAYILDQPVENFIKCHNLISSRYTIVEYINTNDVNREVLSHYKINPLIQARIDEALEVCDYLNDILDIKEADYRKVEAITEALKELNRKADADNKKALSDRKKSQYDGWIAACGTDNQKGRHALGLLSMREVYDCMAAEIFQPLSDFKTYFDLSICKIYCSCYTTDTQDVVTTEKELICLTADQFVLWQQVQKLMPVSTLKFYRLTTYCQTCFDNEDADSDGESIETVFVVNVVQGDLSFTCKYYV
jgi:hypothetical protein